MQYESASAEGYQKEHTYLNTNVFTDMTRFLGSFSSHFMKRAFFSVA